ncbi:MAG: 50S ribosomal protein L25 [Candidatus Saccharimonadales bacterium]
MGNKVELTLEERTVYGKKVAALRRDGIVPAVVYGAGIDPISVQVPENVFQKAYVQAGVHAPVHLTIGGKRKIAMIKDVDFDPVKHRALHVSFHAVKASDPVIAEVPIHLIGEGESEAEKAGFIVLQALDKIEIKALPMDLPDAVEISILRLKEPGEKVTLGEAKLSEGVEFVGHDDGHHNDDEEKPSITDLMVASVWEPAALQAANEATAGEADEGTQVESENGSENNEGTQAEESKPGGKLQAEPKQSNVDANK